VERSKEGIGSKIAYGENMRDSHTELNFWTRAELFTRARSLAFSILPIDEVATEIAFEAMHGAQLCRNKKKHHKDNYNGSVASSRSYFEMVIK